MRKFSEFRAALPTFFGILFFAGMTAWLIIALGNASEASDEERLAQVKQSVENGITLCYATEGAYPENLEHLTENYGVVIDEDKYLVHYECFAANVRPAVTVIRR